MVRAKVRVGDHCVEFERIMGSCRFEFDPDILFDRFNGSLDLAAVGCKSGRLLEGTE